jgi:hypothetical protein
MTLNKTTFAIEAMVLLGIFVAVEWLAYVLTNTRNSFSQAVPLWAGYLVVRVVIVASKARSSSDDPSRSA